jgi:hypothetical protein
MKRSAVAVLLVLAVALLVAGCGGGSSSSSSSTAPEGTPPKATSPNAPAGSKVAACGQGAEQLRATAVDCATARTTMRQWETTDACSLGDASRGSCSLGDFRCQAVKVGRGVSVSCAGPDGDVSFVKPAG